MPALSQLVNPLTISMKSLEIELLLACARTQITDETTVAICQILKHPINWEYLIKLASEHGVLPLFYWNMKHYFSDLIPVSILGQLRDRFQTTLQNNLLYTGELLRLLSHLKDNHISAIPFKGPVFAISAYRNLAFRKFCDLDLLVPKQDVPRVINLLSEQGYQQPTFHDDKGYECQFFHPATHVTIDLHWALAPRFFHFPLSFSELQSRLQPVVLNGQTLQSLSAEDMLLSLSGEWLRDCCHERARLIQLCNVSELIRATPQLDWTFLVQQASKLGCERVLLLTLASAQALLGTPLPESILHQINADPLVTPLTKQICAHLWQQSDQGIDQMPSIPTSAGTYKQELLLNMRERWIDSLTYYFYCLLVPTDQERKQLPLPPFLSLLYYPLRLARLIQKYWMGR